MRCLIGITCGWEENKSWHKLHDEYISAVKEAGGLPFPLPSIETPELIEEYYQRMDGFIFTGGNDLDPHYFGEEPQVGLGEISPRRDTFEMVLAKLVLDGNKPVLGICRGIQLLNIAAEGDIYQDLKGLTGQMHVQQAPRDYAIHTVELLAESALFSLVQKPSLLVNSFHHQAIRRLGNGLKAVAWSKDGLIEAIESSAQVLSGEPKLIAVQWHPECNRLRDQLSSAIFKNLVTRAKIAKQK